MVLRFTGKSPDSHLKPRKRLPLLPATGKKVTFCLLVGAYSCGLQLRISTGFLVIATRPVRAFYLVVKKYNRLLFSSFPKITGMPPHGMVSAVGFACLRVAPTKQGRQGRKDRQGRQGRQDRQDRQGRLKDRLLKHTRLTVCMSKDYLMQTVVCVTRIRPLNLPCRLWVSNHSIASSNSLARAPSFRQP